jgi:hypothetical protein
MCCAAADCAGSCNNNAPILALFSWYPTCMPKLQDSDGVISHLRLPVRVETNRDSESRIQNRDFTDSLLISVGKVQIFKCVVSSCRCSKLNCATFSCLKQLAAALPSSRCRTRRNGHRAPLAIRVWLAATEQVHAIYHRGSALLLAREDNHNQRVRRRKPAG